jgi:hypothetical protein
LPDILLKAGNKEWVDLSYQSDAELEGILAGLKFDELLNILSVMPIPGTDINHSRHELKFLSSAQTLKSGRSLARIQLEAKQDIALKNAVQIDQKFDHEGYDQGMERRKIKLLFQTNTNNIDANELTLLVGPFPNPFNQTSTWTLSNAAATTAVLEVFATSGQLCLIKKIELNQGNNMISVESSELPSAGMYQWKITTEELSKTGKLIRVK